jgi:nifR3 family TIM-barrel protein
VHTGGVPMRKRGRVLSRLSLYVIPAQAGIHLDGPPIKNVGGDDLSGPALLLVKIEGGPVHYATLGGAELSMTAVDQEFLQRVSRIPHHGLGLSVDVYQPDLFELVTACEDRRLAFDYLEIFKASTASLKEVRRRLPSSLLEYHAEGLWVTQPDLLTRYPAAAEVETAAEHLRILGSSWVNFEGASKQMAGYSFGTYLPPLLTAESADITAENLAWVQHELDRLLPWPQGGGPLVLLETPPLTYFGLGDLDMAGFFRRVTQHVPCGLLLDIGHIWTVYRYSADRRRLSIMQFLDRFLDAFPVERVVHLHLAGLAPHEALCHGAGAPQADLPWWIDAHGASIPPVVFDMLERVLVHSRLTQAKGVALEVDTKAIPAIIEEFTRFRNRFAWWNGTEPASDSPPASRAFTSADPSGPPQPAARHELLAQYRTYAELVAGVITVDERALSLPGPRPDPLALKEYQDEYLPFEILRWGGDLQAMFPGTCRLLNDAGVPLERFLAFWFCGAPERAEPYDFFRLKVNRFLAFIRDACPSATDVAEREAAGLRLGYQTACEPANLLTPHPSRLTNFWQTLPQPIIGLAPMDGVTDAAFRLTVARQGPADISVTEFTSVSDICRGPEFLLKSLLYHECERPVVAQLYGKDPDLFYQAAHIVCELGFDGLDINMGCPSRNVASSGSGAALIRTPALAHEIIRAASQGIADWVSGQSLTQAGIRPGRAEQVQALNRAGGKWMPDGRRRIPLSIKTRLGYDAVVIEPWIAHLLEARPAAITVHGRTLEQMYRGQADWEAIARAAALARQTETLLLGNGDLVTLDDVARRIQESHVHGVLVGRGALGNPWFFRANEAARRASHAASSRIPEPAIPLSERFDVMLAHARQFETIFGRPHFPRMRKHLGWYAKHFRGAAAMRNAVVRTSSSDDVERLLLAYRATLENSCLAAQPV